MNVVRQDGKSALQSAIVADKGRSFEMFEALLEAKAEVHVINGDGTSALHLTIASDNVPRTTIGAWRCSRHYSRLDLM